MDTTLTPKNILYWSASLALIVFAASMLWAAFVFAKSASPRDNYRTFSASGEAEVTTIPDVAQLSFSVATEGQGEVDPLQEENTKKINEIISFLGESGIADEDIQTTNYDLNPRYQYYPCTNEGNCRPAEITGYTINQSISVKIRNLSDVGAIISGVTTRGANRINGPRFVVDDPDAAQTQAREEAIKKAKEKAETLAKAGDFRLGKVLSISDNFGGGYPEPYFAEDSVRNFGGAVSKEAPQAAVAPDIQPGSQDIKATVTITYEIK